MGKYQHRFIMTLGCWSLITAVAVAAVIILVALLSN